METLPGRSRQRIATLLESPVTPSTHLARYSICAGSPRLIDGQQRLWTPPLGDVFPFLRWLLRSHQDEDASMKASIVPAELPFTGGWLGWLGYDLAWEIEQLPQHKVDPLPYPIAYWYEPVKRNLFYGSCGYLDWRGNLDLNILIRTLLYTDTSDSTSGAIVWGQVGAGIVADSDPQKEWYESLNKAQAQLNALNLAEKFTHQKN